jgi:rubrerythrin
MRPADWAVEVWNRLVPIGTTVVLKDDLGELANTKTRSQAWVLCNEPVVQVEGRTGGYSLWRIRPTAGREAAHALILHTLELHHQQCFNVLKHLVDTMRAVVARAPPNIRPTMTLHPELIDQLGNLVREVDPTNSETRRKILETLTSAPKVYAPFDPSVKFPPRDVDELREALEAGAKVQVESTRHPDASAEFYREVVKTVRVWDGPTSSEVYLDLLAEDQPYFPGAKLHEVFKACAETFGAGDVRGDETDEEFRDRLCNAEPGPRGWICAVCGLEVHHTDTKCPDCGTERGCG